MAIPTLSALLLLWSLLTLRSFAAAIVEPPYMCINSSVLDIPAQYSNTTDLIPETPAGRQLKSWLTAFNSGDRETLWSYHDRSFKFESMDDPRTIALINFALQLSRFSGGYEFKHVTESEPFHIRAVLKGHLYDEYVEVVFEVVNMTEFLPQDDWYPNVGSGWRENAGYKQQILKHVHSAWDHPVHTWGYFPVPIPVEYLTPSQREEWNLAQSLSPAKRIWLIDSIAHLISMHCTNPPVGNLMIDSLRTLAAAANGTYDNMTDSRNFTQTINSHISTFTNGTRFSLSFGNNTADFPPDPTQSHYPHHFNPDLDSYRRRNFEMPDLRRLEQNIAYLSITAFLPSSLPESRATIACIMTQIADASALILDLRTNRGGDPRTVALVASYLFDDDPILLSTLYTAPKSLNMSGKVWSGANATKEAFWTTPKVNGTKFGGTKPVYVLVSKRTVGRGEELAYSLQALKRATVVGTRTAGVARTVQSFQLDDWWTFVVPVGMMVSPYTGSWWEGVGVRPHVRVEGDAFVEAVRRLKIEVACAGVGYKCKLIDGVMGDERGWGRVSQEAKAWIAKDEGAWKEEGGGESGDEVA